MSRAAVVLLCACLALACSTGARAQEAPADVPGPSAGVSGPVTDEAPATRPQEAPRAAEPVVVQALYRCAPERLSSLDSYYRSEVVPVLRRQVQEGSLLDFQLLAHAWGDQWNWVVSRTAPDLETFFRSHEQLLAELDGEARSEAHAGCEAHKDNIYRRVSGRDDVQIRVDPRDPIP